MERSHNRTLLTFVVATAFFLFNTKQVNATSISIEGLQNTYKISYVNDLHAMQPDEKSISNSSQRLPKIIDALNSDNYSKQKVHVGDTSSPSKPSPPSGDTTPSEPEIPQENLFTPKVTAIHSLNALLEKGAATSDVGVYFIPKLDEFPVSVKDTVSNVTDDNNVEHRFAVVYDGYFDTEVEYVSTTETDKNTGRLQTSKKVYSSVDNTRTLNMLGYDLLLSNEQVAITTNGSSIDAEYKPTRVDTAPLSASTVLMDLYKAVGQYEWDIKYVWVRDNSLTLENSPIQSEIGVAISDATSKGINTKEGATYVWATRTNPKLYWDRVKKDAIFDGGAHSVTSTKSESYIGAPTSVSFGMEQTMNMTFGQFCAVARAVMDLYGEPIMTKQEQQVMIQTYGLSLPSCKDEELFEAVCYLAAKGIIDPSEVSYNEKVTFAMIEPILLRIADKDSRLTFKETNYNTSSELYQKGFVTAKTSLTRGSVESIDTVNGSVTTRYNDYYIQCDDNITNFLLTQDAGKPVLAADKILCNGVASSSVQGYDAVFENLGVEDNFYHFRINDSQGEVVISYDTSDNSGYSINRTSYTLPNANGGVYIVQDGQFVWYSFDEAADKTYTVDGTIQHLPSYSKAYIDKERRYSEDINKYTDFGNLDDYKWVMITLDNAAFMDLDKYRLYDVPLTDIKTATDNTVVVISDGSGISGDGQIKVKHIVVPDEVEPDNDALDKHILVFQVPYDESTFRAHFSDSSVNTQSVAAYFCPTTDDTLVSYDYLRQKGLVATDTPFTNGDRVEIILSEGNTNVILDKSKGIIIVGNTLYKVAEDEMLYTTSNGVLYINYRACIGWIQKALAINSGGNIILTNSKMLALLQCNTYTASMSTFFPTATAQVGVAHIGGVNGQNYVNLAANNPLGNYLMVMSDDGTGTDHLFIWKRREYVLPGSSSILSYGDDSAARQTFKDLTGFDISAGEDFALLHKAYNRENHSSGEKLYYKTQKVQTSLGVKLEYVYGWMYEPDEVTTYSEAITNYLNDQAVTLPIARVNGTLCNLNINYCTMDSTSGLLSAGTMPSDYLQKPRTGLLGLLPKDSGKKVSRIVDASTYEETGASYPKTSNYQILPAPTGMFSSLYGYPQKAIKDIGSSTIWYGSQPCVIINNRLLLRTSRFVIETDENKKVSTLYDGSGKSGIYSYGTSTVGVNVQTDGDDADYEIIETDPNYLVDWDEFRFSRLVSKLDDWSTIWLIFALNIIPRIGMTFFFVLMILSLISDFSFVKKFCHNVFDVYKALTLGFVTVDTVNLKKLFIQSIVALALFSMVCDGILFQFVMWCSELFIELMQR